MLTLIIKPTHRCNLNCVYCYDKDNREIDKSIMSLETVENIFKLASQATDKVNIIWHGGEPMLMGFDFYKTIYEEMLPKYFDLDKIDTSFQTNGTIFDANLLALCEKHNVGLGMSYDGERNDLTRKNTKQLMLNRYKAEICGFENGWNGFLMVITPDNADTVVNTYKTSIREGYQMSFSEVFMKQTEEEAIQVFDIVIDTYIELLDYILTKETEGYIPRPLDAFVKKILKVNHGSMCENMYCKSQWLGIHPDGTVFPCGRDWPHNLNYGNINQIKDLKEIYHTEIYKQLKEGDDYTKKECKDCKLYTMCRGGCPNNKLLIYDNLSDKNFAHCYYTKTMIKRVYQLLSSYKHYDILNREFLDLFNDSNYATYKDLREDEFWKELL